MKCNRNWIRWNHNDNNNNTNGNNNNNNNDYGHNHNHRHNENNKVNNKLNFNQTYNSSRVRMTLDKNITSSYMLASENAVNLTRKLTSGE